MEKAMPDRRKEKGRIAEDYALQYLLENSYAVKSRNWRCRSGELDIVAERAGVLIFVEVRSRSATGRFGTPEESVDSRKQRQIRETAQVYLYRQHGGERPVRFDVVAILLDSKNGLLDLRHIEAAF